MSSELLSPEFGQTSFEKAELGNDLVAGRNTRRFRAKFNVLARQHNLDAGPTWEWYTALNKNPLMDQEATAKALSINWDGLIAFMQALAPIIEEMMANCAAPVP